MLSLIIPVYNEEEAVRDTVEKAHATFSAINEAFEILVMNDGSTDGTAQILSEITLPHVSVFNLPTNRGYGATVKTGLRAATGEVVALTDADGTYPIEEFPRLLEGMREAGADMVVGARKASQIPWIRRPAKCIVACFANLLTGMRIPDNNSGMRIFKKSMALEFMHLYPQSFSFTITITLAALTRDYIVEFIPIEYFERKGKSSLSSGLNGVTNFLRFLGLILRIVMYFRPLRFFAWPSGILTLSGIGYIIYTVLHHANVSDAGVLMLLTGLQIGLFGLLAEIIVRQGRAQRVKL